jgi:hypothetical protein
MTVSNRSVTRAGRRVPAIVAFAALILAPVFPPQAAARSDGFAAHGRGAVTRLAAITFAEAARQGSVAARGHRHLPAHRSTIHIRGKAPRADMQPKPSTALAAPPAPEVTTEFDGLDEATAGFDPPDGWVTVNAAFVIQSVNGLVQISSRTGVPIQQAPTWAVFGIPLGQFESDPRFLWDAAHARWVGSVVSFDGTFINNFMVLAVSETADPLGAWDRYVFADAVGELPDQPTIASSTTKIVIPANEFANGGSVFAGSSILAIDWASIITGGALTGIWTADNDALWSIRPSQVLSPSSDVHLVAEATGGGGFTEGDILYKKLTGTAASTTTAGFVDLTSTTSHGPFFPINPPRQAGNPSTVCSIYCDERPTDAVSRGSYLWLVSTSGCLDGANHDADCVRAVGFNTGSSGTPTLAADLLIGEDAADLFLGGLTIAGDGTVFLAYSRSSASDFVSAKARVFTLAGGLGPEQDLAAGEGTYDPGAYPGRWGDYLGVAADPAGTGAAWVGSEIPAADGTWRTVVTRLVVDSTPPTVTIPTVSLVTPAGLPTNTVPVRVTWTGSDAGSGIDRYLLSQSRDGGATFEPAVTVVGMPAVVRTAQIGSPTQFAVVAVDTAGNASPASAGAIFTPTLYQQTTGTVYSAGWTTVSSAAYSGGSAKSASVAGTYVTFSFTGRAVAFLSYKSTTRGSVRIYVDGVLKKTVSLYSTTVRTRQLVFAYAWPAYGSHKLKLVVVGTAGHPRVDVDGFAVLK